MNTKIKTLIKASRKQIKYVQRKINQKNALYRWYIRYTVPEAEVKAAETNETEKLSLLERYTGIWPDYIEKIRNEIEMRRQSNPFYDRACDRETANDILFCRLAYGFSFDEYFAYHLKDKSAAERRTFISDRDAMISTFRTNDVIDSAVYRDKARTYSVLREYYGREAVYIESEADYPAFLQFIQDKREVVSKRVNGFSGKDIELVSADSWKGKEHEFFESLLEQGSKLLEEKVIQSEEMAAFNSSSVNTIRIITLLTKKGVVAPYSFMKTGRTGSFVDNGGKGGIMFGADPETGEITTDGVDELGNIYTRHPDSGKTFKGFQLPDYAQAVAICKKIALVLPSVKMVGWDLAHTDAGWVVIEGNNMSQLIGPQTVFQRGIRKEFMDLLNQVDLIF